MEDQLQIGDFTMMQQLHQLHLSPTVQHSTNRPTATQQLTPTTDPHRTGEETSQVRKNK